VPMSSLPVQDEAVCLQDGTRTDGDLNSCVEGHNPPSITLKDPFVDILYCTYCTVLILFFSSTV
jgi:hypothetical protein